ncbi:hypothetical protein WJX74_005154 [Apatococcus lobatus]|uniref:S-adenosyl-L-methionine-dependent methyltransferase n=1 Tax=Apatococcus lobatus TaxID=904363 RepID=A0AAW1RYH2_9CHLO
MLLRAYPTGSASQQAYFGQPSRGSREAASRGVRVAATPDPKARSQFEVATLLAARRAEHSRTQNPIFVDNFAQRLASNVEAAPSQLPWDTVATRFLDDQLSQGIDIVNMELEEDYRQVVLLGCGMDTRPYRLMWPAGTVLYEVAPAEVHAAAVAALQAASAKVQRGCLHIRVSADLEAGDSLGEKLARAGFSGNRLSIWGLQGLTEMQLSPQLLRQLLADVADNAAFGSMVMGELPGLPLQMAEDLLAEAGMLGRVLPFGQEETSFGIWPEQPIPASQADATDGAAPAHRLLFTAQHQRLSLQQMNMFSDHVQAAEETDEDFFGNFS